MKIALYVEDGLEQIVLTPQGDTEKALLSKLQERELSVYSGSFYACRGGWITQGTGTESTILVLQPKRQTGGEIAGIVTA